MIGILLQATTRVDARAAIQEHFTKKAWDYETWKGIIVVGAAILILLVLLHAALYYERRGDKNKFIRNPQKLFRELLTSLPLSADQRELLRRIVRDLALDAPADMLVSPRQFGGIRRQWFATSKSGEGRYGKELDRISRLIFAIPTDTE